MVTIQSVNRFPRPQVICMIVLVMACFVLVYLYSLSSNNGAQRSIFNIKNVIMSIIAKRDNKPHLVMGSLSISREFRDAQRRTFLTTIKEQKDELPFRVTHEFLIDNHTEETDDENRLHGDLFFMNTRALGYGSKFGEKLYRWFKHVSDKYPDAQLVVKMDDDAFLCVPQVFWRLHNITSPRMYYGWLHNFEYKGNTNINRKRRMDEFFVAFGGEIIKRIASRRYCRDNCDITRDLIDTNWGGTSIGVWLSIYNDIDIQIDNERLFQMGRSRVAVIPNYVDENTCKKYTVFHKSSVKIMHQLHAYNNP